MMMTMVVMEICLSTKDLGGRTTMEVIMMTLTMMMMIEIGLITENYEAKDRFFEV